MLTAKQFGVTLGGAAAATGVVVEGGERLRALLHVENVPTTGYVVDVAAVLTGLAVLEFAYRVFRAGNTLNISGSQRTFE